MCVFFPFILDVRLVDVPAVVTHEEGLTVFLIHLASAVLGFIFNFSREKDSAVPFPRRPLLLLLLNHTFSVLSLQLKKLR